MRKFVEARRGLLSVLLAVSGIAAVVAPVLLETRSGTASDTLFLIPFLGAAGWLAFLFRFSRGFVSATALILAGVVTYLVLVVAAAGLSMTLFA